MSSPPPGLTRFFDAVVPILRGDAPASAARAIEPGYSAHDVARLAMFGGMVRRQRALLLEKVFRATCAAWALEAPEGFEEAVAAHLADEGGAEPDYPSIALGFADRVASAAPSWVAEVADWEECLHRLRVVGAPPVDPGLRGPVLARAYSFDVPAWTKAARRGVVARPTASPTPVLAFRDREETLRRLRPGPGHVAALAVARGEATPEALASVVPAEAIATAAAELTELGLLAEPGPRGHTEAR